MTTNFFFLHLFFLIFKMTWKFEVLRGTWQLVRLKWHIKHTPMAPLEPLFFIILVSSPGFQSFLSELDHMCDSLFLYEDAREFYFKIHLGGGVPGTTDSAGIPWWSLFSVKMRTYRFGFNTSAFAVRQSFSWSQSSMWLEIITRKQWIQKD